jgi:thiol:disulfide interchange protein DsbC
MRFNKFAALAALVAASLATGAHADEAAIRKSLAERLPQFPKIEEVRNTPMPGLFEVRVGLEVFYTDADGNFLIQGHLIDTRNQRDLTAERVDKLSAIDFASLPFKDAFTIVRGNGKRKLAVFEDPNCSYCKRFERELQKVDNVTVHLFLFPILGPDSADKARNIWCSKEPGRAWQDWMVRDQATPTGKCDTGALVRNVEFGKKYRIGGTPTLLFTDGSRVPGAVSAQQVEKLLAEAK